MQDTVGEFLLLFFWDMPAGLRHFLVLWFRKRRVGKAFTIICVREKKLFLSTPVEVLFLS